MWRKLHFLLLFFTDFNCSDLEIAGVKHEGLISCNTTSMCIYPSWICDHSNDCWDNNDEKNCNYTGEGQRVVAWWLEHCVVRNSEYFIALQSFPGICLGSLCLVESLIQGPGFDSQLWAGEI